MKRIRIFGLLILTTILTGCENLEDLDFLIENTPYATTNYIEDGEYNHYAPTLILATYARIPVSGEEGIYYYVGTSSTLNTAKAKKITNSVKADPVHYIEVDGLTPNTTYYYWEARLNEVGKEIYSKTPVSFTTNNFSLGEIEFVEVNPNFVCVSIDINDFDKLNLQSSQLLFTTIQDNQAIQLKGQRIEGTNTWQMNFISLRKGTTYEFEACFLIDFQNNPNWGPTETLAFSKKKTITTPTSYVKPEFVDLGLGDGLKWATCNLGATSPYQTGGYYGYGEFLGYSLGSITGSFTRPTTSIAGTSYDIVTSELGQGYRLPTANELSVLNNYCTWTLQGDVMRCTGPNGNSIDFPLAGWVAMDSYDNPYQYYYGYTNYGFFELDELQLKLESSKGPDACYLSGTVNSSASYKDYYYLQLNANGAHQINYRNKTALMTIRPVCEF